MSEKNLSIDSKIVLNNKIEMPILGLGTWNLRGSIVENVIDSAYSIGYRHFDTATYYRNEGELGKALNKYSREDFFLTTKIWPNEFGFEKTLRGFEGNLNRLGFSYVDQLLIHWPGDKQKMLETWEAFCKILDEGKTKSIGVSNFSIQDIQLLKEANDFIPATNQIKYTPSHINQKLLDFCKSKEIIIVAYSPLNEGRGLKNKTLAKIASKYNKTVAQVLLRWNIQQGVVTIPKSSRKERLEENANIFDFKLTNEEMNLVAKSDF
jgi:diketogulonate reductase-like aldo/keto reductase